MCRFYKNATGQKGRKSVYRLRRRYRVDTLYDLRVTSKTMSYRVIKLTMLKWHGSGLIVNSVNIACEYCVIATELAQYDMTCAVYK